MASNESFHYPAGDGPFFGRTIATTHTEKALWAAVQVERSKKTKVVVSRWLAGDRTDLVLETDGLCHQPCLTASDTDRVFVAWNEFVDGTWAVKGATLSERTDVLGETELIHCGPGLHLPPTAAFRGGEAWVAWAGGTDGRIRIHLAKRGHQGWKAESPVSAENVDAFRPCLAHSGNELLLAWDQYRKGAYEVVVVRPDDGEHPPFTIDRQAGERFLGPKLAVTPDGTGYATWLSLHEVTDSLGIIDHLPFAPVARLGRDQAHYLRDAASPVDARAVADLRDGLLASGDYAYQGYSGLRRNPMLSVAEDGGIWLLWECRFWHESSSTAGHLLGRKLLPDSSWAIPVILHSGGYAYSVAPCMIRNALPVSFLRHDGEDMGILCAERIDVGEGRPHTSDSARWARWHPARIEAVREERASVDLDGEPHGLFWADTHCHSMVSSDAEGEVDELIHFARDVAGLDAVCIIDNDHYPHKALTHAEWQMHQEFCTHFTKEGAFVAFPGWEYTYHRRDLSPDFNHRCILYPRPGWPIYRRIDPEARVDRDLFHRLKSTPAMCYPHHSTYEIVDPELDWNVEICSSWRVCIEENDFTIRQLLAGQRFGFIGSSDSHRALPGLGGALTGVFATELTPEALFEAYRQRRTVATQGQRILIDFRANDTFIGGESRCTGAPELTAHVQAPDPIEFVELLRDGICVHRVEPGASSCDVRFTDVAVQPGEHVYFVRAKLAGDPSFNEDPAENFLGAFTRAGRYGHNLARARGPFAWTSPVWMRVCE